MFIGGGAYKEKLRFFFEDGEIPAALGGLMTVTSQEFINAKSGPPPPTAAVRKGWKAWFGLGCSKKDEGRLQRLNDEMEKSVKDKSVDEKLASIEFDQETS